MLKKELSKSTDTLKITFKFHKKAITGAKEVRIVGEFNNWDWNKAPVMKATETGN